MKEFKLKCSISLFLHFRKITVEAPKLVPWRCYLKGCVGRMELVKDTEKEWTERWEKYLKRMESE